MFMVVPLWVVILGALVDKIFDLEYLFKVRKVKNYFNFISLLLILPVLSNYLLVISYYKVYFSIIMKNWKEF